MDIVLMIVYATLILGFLVFIHEGGHYLAARAFGVRVTEFMLGLPGPNIGFTKWGTKFGVTPFLLGGYAKVCGMEPGEMSPHLEAVLAALEVVRDDEWMKDCHLWLYRGAWMEWELGMVDMAVPLSPDELIMKRHAIYRHLSQKDIMPFPGDDPREFWQRAEERTQNTAKLYDQLGMAEYQAIEVFVKMF